MKTQKLVSGLIGSASTGAGIVAGQQLKAKLDLGLDPMVQNALHIVLGGVVLPMLAKGKAGAAIEAFGFGIAGEAAADLINGYLLPASTPAVSGNMYGAVRGWDNRSNFLAGPDNAGSFMGSNSQPSNRSVAYA